ncbi:MAG TPA: putative hydro-lyase [Candidatus Sulfotelmatobacter sp.]|nr:putative hydro-lyase [Candidatus Sulfotelmatobacter sp.]
MPQNNPDGADRSREPATPLEVRRRCRAGAHDGPTAGLAPGFVQGNLAILPRNWAHEFLRYCQANPKPCPLLGVSDCGSPHVRALGADLDLRTDLPRYRVWREGELVGEPCDLLSVWRDDLVSFVIGCSFSFEEALLQAGLPLRHLALGCNVPMYRTNMATERVGRLHGPLVVSMRPLRPAHAIRAVQITTRLPAVHGAPVHIGLPEAIGIADLARPDYGDAVPVAADELPVFWACGVTPQAVIAAARPPFAITHAPGCMLVTDLRNAELALF